MTTTERTEQLKPGQLKPGQHRHRSKSRRVAWVCGLTLGLVATTSQSAAFWSATSTPGSGGGASATSIARGDTPQVSVSDRRDVTVSWAASTLGDGTPVTGYVVRRYDASGTGRPAENGCSATLTARSCTEAGVPDGLWTYTVTPRYASWTGEESTASGEVRTDVTVPTNDISLQSVSGGSVRVGASTFYYRGTAAGSFRLVNALRDTGSGPAQSVTGVLSGATAGWSHQASSVATPAGGPFVSNLFSWTAGTTTEPTVGISGIDAYGNVAPTALTFRLDNDTPTGGAVDYPDGVVSPSGAATTTTIPVTVATASDSRAGVASRILEVSDAALSGSSCGSFGAWRTETQNPPATYTDAVTAGRCYRFRHVVTDAVGNQLVATSPNVTKVRSYQNIITSTTGLAGYWRLDDTNTVVDALRGTDGSYGPGNTAHLPARGAAGAIAGDTNTAVSFDGVDDWARLNRTVSTTFSIEFWFRTDQNPTYGTGTQWWDGAGLVDAEVAGAANDFGVSLMNGGRVAAGTGNPDRTVRSGTGYNDNRWHHVVMTRTGGTVVLYVDGASQGTFTDGNTAALTAPTYLNLGRLQTGVNHYRGQLDEVAVYTSVLPAATVANHYQSGLP